MNIQIVMPIYNAFEATQNAIQALIKHNKFNDVVLINDASSDDRIMSLFNDLPERWQLLHNLFNLGFVKTANIGLKTNSGHSILLNSDTLVTTGWFQRFEQAIESVEHIGTITPWSNNAEICSLPLTLTSNPIPSDIDLLASELNDKHEPNYPELATAVGFCMLISAEAKKHVGYFDEATFGMGYGEENDYSLRVNATGLRNILVDNCYVAHLGNQSFQEHGLKPNQSTMDRLLTKHPDYGQLIQKFIENDPLAELRESIIAKINVF